VICAVIRLAALIQLKAAAASVSNIGIGFREVRHGYCRSWQAQPANPFELKSPNHQQNLQVLGTYIALYVLLDMDQRAFG
jgi:hypothetical protein